MVSYKKKYLESQKMINKLKANRIDISKEATDYRIKNGIPLLLHKFRWRIEEQPDKYLLYDVQK